jgi:hypothetical protein
LVTRDANEICWFSFAGSILNSAFAEILRRVGLADVQVSDFCIRISELATDVTRPRPVQ